MALSTGQTVLLLIAFLTTGSANTILSKMQYGLEGVGLSGKKEYFTKPWFQTLNMMLAMWLVMIIDRAVKCCCMRTNSEKKDPLLDKPPITPKKVVLVAIPAFFDILATALGALGMLYIDASVWQMLRGSSLIFAAMFSIIFLKRKLLGFNWLGLLLCILGVGTVGYANIANESSKSDSSDSAGDTTKMFFGMSLTIAAQVVQAAQVIAEEFLMKDLELPPFDVIGYEGFWGAVQMVFVVLPVLYFLPGSDHGRQEDTFNSLAMIFSSSSLFMALVGFQISCALFNVTGITITSSLSAVHRMMIDASRTMVVWGFDLFVYYAIDKSSSLGETWTSWSGVQLVGFIILLAGQATYGQVVKIPGLYYPDPVLPKAPSLAFSTELITPGRIRLGSAMDAYEDDADPSASPFGRVEPVKI